MTKTLLLVVSLFSLSVRAADVTSFETVPPEEAKFLPALVKGTEAGLQKSFVALEKKIEELKAEKKDPKGIVKAVRDAHPLAHGCVRADFEVLPAAKIGGEDLPESVRVQLKQGLFANAKTYKAYVRYSNGSSEVQPDYVPDGRGMAIKVVGVDGQRFKLEKINELHTQDFLMINHPQFFVKNLQDYAMFFADKAKFISTHEEERKIVGGIAMQITTTPTANSYFSMTPVLYGKNAIKYNARPCTAPAAVEKIGDLDLAPLLKVLKSLKQPSDVAAHVKDLSPKYDRYLRQALKNTLAANDVCYDFYVQFHENQTTEPIENPTVKWNTKFYRVARITIPKQDFTKGRQDEFCENLALTPWHSIVEHQPLGGVQRARLPIYESISQMRREFNLKHKLTTPDLLVEPTGYEKL